MSLLCQALPYDGGNHYCVRYALLIIELELEWSDTDRYRREHAFPSTDNTLPTLG
jgi:hypothetical protein